MPQTVHIRGEGGQVIAMDLPLPEAIQQRLDLGALRRVNEDGTPYTGTVNIDGSPYQGTPRTGADDETAGDLGRTPSGRPAVNASKSEWIAYTVAQGQLSADDAANYTKQDLIDMAN